MFSLSAMELGCRLRLPINVVESPRTRLLASSFVRMDGRPSGVRAETKRGVAQTGNIPLGNRAPVREERSGLNLVTRQWAPGSMFLRRSSFSSEAAIPGRAPSFNVNVRYRGSGADFDERRCGAC